MKSLKPLIPAWIGRAMRLEAARDKHWLETRSYTVYRGQLPSSIYECDAWIITGSPGSAYDMSLTWNEPLRDFVRAVAVAERSAPRLAGVCFGHQLVAAALGGRVEKVGWSIGVERMRIVERTPWMHDNSLLRQRDAAPPLAAYLSSTPPTDALLEKERRRNLAVQRRRRRAKEPPQPQPPPLVNDDTVHLVYSHQDQVVERPPGATLIGSRDACPIDMLAYSDRIFTAQGHFELAPFFAARLYTARRAAYGNERYETAMQSVLNNVPPRVLNSERNRLNRWLINFFKRFDLSSCT